MIKHRINRKLFIIIIMLVIFGLFMVYSASNVVALYRYDDKAYFLKRQLIFAIIGIAIMILFIHIDIRKIYKATTYIYVAALIMLILVLIPGIGVVRGGARSWIGFGSFSIQPAEFMKLAIILLIAKYLSNHHKDLKKPIEFIKMLILIVSAFGLIMLQPDFGTGLVLVVSCILLLFNAGVPLKYFLILLGLGIIGIIALIASAPYRLERIFAFLDPWSDPLGSGFQSIQSLFAIAPSGLFGLGYNNSMQKHFFLPEPQNDFIFAIICEEFGLIGGLLVIGVFLYIVIEAVKISLHVDNKYLKFLSLGIGLSLFTQVFINIGVVIGLLPVTGITLPLISYGGSSLVITLFSLGIIAQKGDYDEIYTISKQHSRTHLSLFRNR